MVMSKKVSPKDKATIKSAVKAMPTPAKAVKVKVDPKVALKQAVMDAKDAAKVLKSSMAAEKKATAATNKAAAACKKADDKVVKLQAALV